MQEKNLDYIPASRFRFILRRNRASVKLFRECRYKNRKTGNSASDKRQRPPDALYRKQSISALLRFLAGQQESNSQHHISKGWKMRPSEKQQAQDRAHP